MNDIEKIYSIVFDLIVESDFELSIDQAVEKYATSVTDTINVKKLKNDIHTFINQMEMENIWAKKFGTGPCDP